MEILQEDTIRTKRLDSMTSQIWGLRVDDVHFKKMLNLIVNSSQEKDYPTVFKTKTRTKL